VLLLQWMHMNACTFNNSMLTLLDTPVYLKVGRWGGGAAALQGLGLGQVYAQCSM
jgi:hypothetical protein